MPIKVNYRAAAFGTRSSVLQLLLNVLQLVVLRASLHKSVSPALDLLMTNAKAVLALALQCKA